MDSENKKSDAEEILSEFQKTHVDEPTEEPQAEAEPQVEAEPQAEAEPQVEAEPQAEKESKPTHETHNTIFIGIKPIMSYVTATLTQLASSEKESKPTHETHNTIFIGIKPIMSYVTATLTQLASLPIVTIAGRGKRITQAIDVSQMIVKRMNEVGYEIGDVRISSDSLVSKDGKKRNVSKIEIDLKNSSSN